jgi:GalNAc-alpha-(1->4)-GalNAc-alpha-(1->3)-diNAcBac-PP-undecaprenol alpha-1,4-N-acetyl-D-galactosaminyltransferase
MRITLVISSLQSGGAERVMSIMANYWAARSWDVTLLTLDGSTQAFYELNRRIKLVPLDLFGNSVSMGAKLQNNLRRVRGLRRGIRASNPQAVISFMSTMNIITLLATRGLPVPVIVSERIDPATYPIGRVWKHLRLWTYPMADRLVLQSERASHYFPSKIRSRVSIIPNPVVSPPSASQIPSDRQQARPLLVGMGRLVHQKGFDLLIRAFARLGEHQRDWTVLILGEGPARIELEALRSNLGLDNRVLLPGRIRNVHEVLQQADLFVMPSRYEGFPNALCEAMACGLPVICTDCPSGPREIIRHGIDGFLVANENIEALTSRMDQLMGSEAERKRLASRAPEVKMRFSLESIMQMWEETLYDII